MSDEFSTSDEDQSTAIVPKGNKKLLTCPIRGPLNSSALASDGLTITEEARRIDLINFLLKRGYPKTHFDVETVILTKLGEKGRNKLRADLVVYQKPVGHLKNLEKAERIKNAVLVAEVKRDSKSKKSGVEYQLEPALRLLPSMNVVGIYWDDINQILFTKRTEKEEDETIVVVNQDTIANLPPFGGKYKSKPITVDVLVPPKNLMGVLFSIANVLRSHKINDEHTRYKETVKLILARYCDERDAAKTASKQLALQVMPGLDKDFKKRVGSCYQVAAKRYSRAETLFKPQAESSLPETALRDVVRAIQGLEFSSAPSEVMQQVFMSFVPAVFKKSLDQYFTPISLIEAMVDMVRIGPNDTIADPALGTGDFLTAAISSRLALGEEDIVQRVKGSDADPMAFDLAVVNMILHKDGQSGFLCEDSIQHYERWAGEIGIALCNPPFGENSLERRAEILAHYDLGYVWEYNEESRRWTKTERLHAAQQLGILFIEKCFKLLAVGGRVGIILPEGYLCTSSYGYVRQWIIDNFRILSLVELPRRIFTRSEADLRGNVLIAQKLAPASLAEAIKINYPIHAELVRRVGFKMGKGFSLIPKRDEETGVELRDENNNLVIDSDFDGVRERFSQFEKLTKWRKPIDRQPHNIGNWKGGRIRDITNHSNLDMKPRRLTVRALENVRELRKNPHIKLGDIAEVLEITIDLADPRNFTKEWRLVEGIDIRAVEGIRSSAARKGVESDRTKAAQRVQAFAQRYCGGTREA